MKKILMLTLALVWCVLSVQAQTRFWVSATAGTWSNPANWGAAATGPGGAGVPTSSNNVQFTSNFNGNCIVDVVAPSVVNVVVNGYTGTIDLNGNTLTTTGTGTFTTGTISNTGASASLALGGTSVTFNGTLFNADVTGSSGLINFNGSVFNGTVDVTKTGATNDNGTGGNTFNGAVTLTNTGTVGQMQLANVNPDIFNGILTLNMNGTSAIAVGRVASGNQYNQNILINYNATGTVAIGSQGGSGTLASGRTITVASFGPSGCGNLTLARFNAPSAQIISLAGNNNALLTLGPASIFGGDLAATSPGIILNSSTFQGITQLTKTGSTDDGQRGGNVFNGVFTLNNNGAADFRFGSNAADAGDTWNSNATFNNTGGARIRVGESTTGNVFMADATFNALGSVTDVADRIQISRLTGAETTFNGTTTINNLGVTSDIQICYDPGTLTTFNGPLFFNESTTGLADDAIGGEGNVVINSDLTITNTSSNIIYMSSGGGTVTFGNGTMNIGGAGFTNGQLRIRNFTQTGTGANALTLTGTASLRVGPVSTFNGNVDFRAPQLQMESTTYNGQAIFEKTGAGNNTSNGGNTFNGITTFTNSGTGYMILGGANADQFGGVTTFNNTGSSRIYIAHNHPGQTTTFAGAVTINSNKTGSGDNGSIFIAENDNSFLSFGSSLTLNCEGSIRSDCRMLNGTGTTAVYNGTFTVRNTNSNIATAITLGAVGTSTYNGNIVVSNINGPTQVLFNTSATASSTLAAGLTIAIGADGFADGTLSLPRFTQTGGTSQTLTLTGTGLLAVGPASAFGGNVDFKAPQIQLHGGTYSGTAAIEKTGATDNTSSGGNTFNGTTTIVNSGSGQLILGSGNADQFNAATVFSNTGSHRIAFAHNHTGQTTTFASTLVMNSNRSGAIDQWSFLVCENAGSNVSFGGNVTMNWQGSVRSDYRILNGAGSTASYTGALTVNLSNSHTATALILGQAGTSTYGGDISLSNTGGAAGIYFNNGAAASSTLTNSAILLNGLFVNGSLSLPRFTQTGIALNTLTNFSGTTLLTIGPASAFGGDVDFRAPRVLLNGCTYGGITNIEKNGAGDNTGAGGDIFQSTTTLTNSSTGSFELANTLPVTFNGNLTANNTGTSRMQIGISSANNVFNGTTTFNHGGNTTGNLNFIVAREPTSSATFNGPLFLNCTNNSSTSGIIIANEGTVTINGNITVSNSTGRGILLASANGAVTLASGFTIKDAGPGTFTGGMLMLSRFTQLGPTPQALTLTGTALLNITASQFNGSLNFRSAQVTLSGTTFNDVTTIEKTGAGDNPSAGGNVFNAITTLNNSGSGNFMMGNGTADQFNAAAAFNNTGSYRMQFAHNHPGQTTTFASDVTLNSNKSGGTDNFSILGAENGTSHFSVNGNLTINCSGTLRSDIRLLNGTGSSASYNGDVTVNITNSNANTNILMGSTGTSLYNGNITVTSTNSGVGSGIFFNGAATASSTLAATKTISIGGAGFIGGTLSLIRFTQAGATPQALTLTGTGRLIVGPSSSFNGNVNFVAPQVNLNGCTYAGTASIEKNGATDNNSAGGNIFNGMTTITNSGSGALLLQNTNADQFNAATTFNNTGSYRIYIASSHAGQNTTFASDVAINSNKTGSGDGWSYLIGDGTNTQVTFNGNVAINCAGTIRSDHRTASGAGSSLVFNGNLTVNCTNTNAATVLNLGNTGTHTFNGNVAVSNSGGISGIFFNAGVTASATLAAARTISIAGGGFTSGTLSLVRFTQTGSTAQSLSLSGTSTLVAGPAVSFDGNVDFRSPQILLHGGIYNGSANFEKTGAGANDSNGGNTFNGATTITNSGTSRLRLASTTGDAYNGAVTFVKTGSGLLDPAYALTNTFAGDITTNTNTAIAFGGNGGIIEFTGGNVQSVSRAGSTAIPTMPRIRINKSAGTVTLNMPITITATATFISGVMNTTPTNVLIIADDATVSGANNASYVSGPVQKTGNDAFTFPVGADNFYRPIGISAPSNPAHSFTAQFFHAAQAFGDKTTWDPSFWTVSACDYWTLDRTNGTSSVSVTLSWNDAICGGAGYITSLPGLRVTRWDAATSKWVNHGNGSTSGSASNGTITSAGAVTTFSPFALASVTRLNPLPVELTDFHATDLGATVSLDWTTASELNSKSFTLQRSQNGLDYNDLTEIAAAGTKITTSRYNFIDESPYGGRSYYRLKQTDYNGDVSYPGITSIQRAGESAAFNAYPNPAGNEVVHFTQKANITIINSLNQEIGSAQGVTNIDVSGLKAGVYIIRNQNGQVVKLVKK